MSLRAAAVFAGIQVSLSLPGDEALAERIEASRAGKVEEPCTLGVCAKPEKKHERLMNTQPGYQWGDAGGYCGSWSIQRAAMAKGAWISQQQVRDHTVPGGGHDEEILETNIDEALKNLKLQAEGFDYKSLPTPQLDSGRKWMKKQLAAGNALVQMIMLPSGHYPVYPNLPYGTYSHIEPIVGIMSDHPLTDEHFYDDDYIVHYNDASTSPLYRSMQSLPGTYRSAAQCPGAGGGSSMCLHPERVFSWAIQDLQDTAKGLPVSLNVDPWQQEPDIREGDRPTQVTGTLTIEGLQAGQKYALYRWDSVRDAFDYSKPFSVHNFVATNATEIYTDPKTFSSAGATYYRCVVDSSVLV